MFVFFGGTDSDNETGKALDAIASLRRSDLTVDVVFGPGNPHAEQLVRRWGGESWLSMHRNVGDMAALMARADFAIGASGAAAWERCCVGLPTICIAIALNQVAIAQGLAEQGACRYLGVRADVTQDDIAAAVIDQFGLLGATLKTVDLSRGLGIVLLLAGTWLVVR